MREDRSISWDQLQQSILSKLYYLMISGTQAQVLDIYLPIFLSLCLSLPLYFSPSFSLFSMHGTESINREIVY